MGAEFIHKCDKCGYSVSTSGPWEFYRDTNGKRKFYGHPVPESEEARQRGIYGLSGNVYCSNCDKTFDIILVEFKEPSQDSLWVWCGRCEPKDEFKKKGAVKCPECGNINLILEPVGKKVTCPRCNKGKLVGHMMWIS